MGSSVEEEVVIVGGGIAGLATAVALKRVGIRALVLERSQGLRTTGAALTLGANAWRALAALGVSHKLTSLYSPLSKGSIYDIRTGEEQQIVLARDNGGSIYDIRTGEVQQMVLARDNGDPTEGLSPVPVHRKALLEALAQELPVDSIRFSSKLTAIEQIKEQGGEYSVIAHLEDGNTIKSKVLIGCDGVHSEVAQWLGLDAPVHSGRFAVRGVATYPSGHGIGKVVYQFIDVDKRAGYVPLTDTDVYWFLVNSPSKGDHQNMARDPKQIQKEVLDNYARDMPDSFLDVVQHADISSLSWAPLMLRYPWAILLGNLSKGNVTVAGDAMHPMTPDMAQGGCSALEDAVILGRHIGNSFLKNGRLVPADMVMALDGYCKERRWRVAGLVAKSYLSGWVQRSASNWLMKFLRDAIFYKHVAAFLATATKFDCGELPSIASRGVEKHSEKND